MRYDTIQYDTLFYVELNKVFCMSNNTFSTNNKSIKDGMAIQISLLQVPTKVKK